MTINTCGMFIESFTVINVSNNGNTALLSVSIGNDLPGSAIQYCLKDANQNILTNYTEVAITTRVSSSLAYVTINDNNLPNTTYLTLRLYNSCGGCGECSSKWNPALCVPVTMRNISCYDGGYGPGFGGVEEIGTINLPYFIDLTYHDYTYELEYSNGVWSGAGPAGAPYPIVMTFSNMVLDPNIGYEPYFTINFQNLFTFRIQPVIKYRRLYNDYIIVDKIATLGFDNDDYDTNLPSCTNDWPVGLIAQSPYPYSLIIKNGFGAIWLFQSFRDGMPSYVTADNLCLFRYNNVWTIAQNCDPNLTTDELLDLFGEPYFSNTVPLGVDDGTFPEFVSLGRMVMSFQSNCAPSPPLDSCENCINTPAVLYTTLPKYENYFSGCSSRPINIDIDACDGTVNPTTFSKSSFVLYYQGGSTRPFLIVDDNAYDVRGVTGLVKIFETNNAADMRTQVCNRIRFATLLDETLLETNLDSALISDWSYNDLYWYSACDNLPSEIPVYLIPD